MLGGLEFQFPWGFLLVIPLFFILYKGQKIVRKMPILMPSLNPFGKSKIVRYKDIGYKSLYWIRILALFLLIVAICRPRVRDNKEIYNTTNGVDIMMVIDVSMSMLAKDLTPNRLEALKEVAGKFIKQRKSDRIGVVIYSGEAALGVPLTTDKGVLSNFMSKRVQAGEMEDGTAIGVGLATGINHIKDSEAKSKIIVLMTDGVNNVGVISPEDASSIAKEKNIKIYTIGIGTNGMAEMPMATRDGKIVYAEMPTELDETLLQSIAKETGGEYFRAQTNQELKQIYKEIDQLEKSNIKNKTNVSYIEKYRIFVILALLLLLIEVVVRRTLFKSIN